MFAMSREQDRISQLFGATQPKSIVEAFDRLGFANLHIMVLRRRDGISGLSGTRERGEAQGIVAALLNAEEPDALDGEQPVDRRLNVGAHVPGKLPRRCDQSIQRDAGEMPFNGGTGKVEPLCFRDGAELLCSCQHTVVADQRRLADQTERILGKLAAQLAAIIADIFAGVSRHRQLIA